MTASPSVTGDPADQSAVAVPENSHDAAPATTRRHPRVVERGSRQHLLMLLAGCVIAAVVVLAGSGVGQFQMAQLTQVMIFAIAITGLNIATGYTGLISVGHSAFFGLGAYTTGILIVSAHWSPVATIPAAFVVCFAAGLLVGLPALRIRGLYLAIATLAFGVSFPEVIDRFDGLTGGAFGLTIRMNQLRPPAWTGLNINEQSQWLYWLSFVVLVVVLLISSNIIRSRYGLALMATRDNELAAASSGVNIAVVKTVSFGVSGALTGMGGSLFAMYLGSLVADDSFTLLLAISLLTGLVIGGQGTRFGPILGGLAVVYIPYYTSSFGQGEVSAVIFGVLLILLIFIAPEGISGFIFRETRRWLRVIPRRPEPFVGSQQPADAPTQKGSVA
ncbi:branched-chain amino acid ABC transporter permease [Rudaeicoccus suwonensis]|uniref:Amino acid/amide ABC transporter membrane protein 2 (HAAT family) n=1 Tax=Rudaeicoccus suwonensis TaxID=657409 RepID=A0A561DWY4_9MICO|nr:branched-chain amino acid ABC transporter permease [Rudaeicoccus suwonensis]TWE07879.1 amino acid/amide ABC transporter membrane protein 2 (HAAT family) [Rudaeicoccus suwonensis]